MRKMLFAATGIAVTLTLIPSATLANDRGLVCYMVTTRGQVVNLNRLCGSQPQPRPAGPEAAEPTPAATAERPALARTTSAGPSSSSCYMTTSNRRFLDLSNLCGTELGNSPFGLPTSSFFNP